LSFRRATTLAVLFVGIGGGSAHASAQTVRAKSINADARPSATVDQTITLVVDGDDDDGDGTADGEQAALPIAARVDLATLDARYRGATLQVVPTVGTAEVVRVVVDGHPVAWGERLRQGAQLQGLSPGRTTLLARTDALQWSLVVDVHAVGFRDGRNARMSAAHQRASIQRTPPARMDLENVDIGFDDPDALRLVVESPDSSSLGPLTMDSLAADGSALDVLRDVSVSPIRCALPAVGARACFASAPLRLVSDDVDSGHPLVARRSLRGEVGGALVVRDSAGKKLQAMRVAGPRESSVGPIERHRVTLRPFVLRTSRGGPPAVGGTDAGAVNVVRAEVALAAATWGQCGVSFGPLSQVDVRVVNPPPPYLVAMGNDLGLPASGGELRFRIDGQDVRVETKKNWSPRQVALALQRQATRVGVQATLSENARIQPGAAPSVDVALRRADGQLSSVTLLSSTDATLAVQIGAVDLTDGLQHFADTDSVAGTLEERTLVKAFDDADPSTIELLVIPYFSGGGRIGESFIASDGSSLRNVVLVDRAGVRSRRASQTVAHELGHVILDEPGHPDDFGVDTPTRLMDSDASDSSPFGPRRLTVEECARAVRQSGPNAHVPLLVPWKLSAMKYPPKPR
jgi:hypothetical protein